MSRHPARPLLIAASLLSLSALFFAASCEPDCIPVCEGRSCGEDSCGGSCGACAADSDCLEGACVVRPTCIDGAANGEESDVDCGGQGCPACADGKRCASGADCASGRCEAGLCSSCADGLLNGPEGDVDCGGDCAPCADGKGCSGDEGCASGRCSEGLCASCQDGVASPPESDVDCGGPCEPCRQGAACLSHADCASRTCILGRCEDPTCTDAVLNQGETDTDCGGSECPRCALGKRCAAHADCLPGACFDGLCAVPECEIQRDCGDIVYEIETGLCLDKRCEPCCEIDPATGETRKVSATVEARFHSTFSTAPAAQQPRTVVLRLISPVKLDGTRIGCAEVRALAGATQAARNRIDYDSGLNLVYRNLFNLSWTPGTTAFDLPVSLPRAGEAILYGEAWYGPVEGELNPTGNRASAYCLEPLHPSTLGEGARLRLDFNP